MQITDGRQIATQDSTSNGTSEHSFNVLHTIDERFGV